MKIKSFPCDDVNLLDLIVSRLDVPVEMGLQEILYAAHRTGEVFLLQMSLVMTDEEHSFVELLVASHLALELRLVMVNLMVFQLSQGHELLRAELAGEVTDVVVGMRGHDVLLQSSGCERKRK